MFRREQQQQTKCQMAILNPNMPFSAPLDLDWAPHPSGSGGKGRQQYRCGSLAESLLHACWFECYFKSFCPCVHTWPLFPSLPSLTNPPSLSCQPRRSLNCLFWSFPSCDTFTATKHVLLFSLLRGRRSGLPRKSQGDHHSTICTVLSFNRKNQHIPHKSYSRKALRLVKHCVPYFA